MPNDHFYKTAEWQTFRREFLRRNPRCIVPGCPLKATHVDHIVSRRKGGLPFDPYNCQAMCAAHHNAKTARVDRPSYKSSNEPLKVKGCDENGWPIDPKHSWRR